MNRQAAKFENTVLLMKVIDDGDDKLLEMLLEPMSIQWRIQDFPDGGAPTPEGGAPTYYLTNFSQKLHENEENLTQRGGARVPAPPPRSANAIITETNNHGSEEVLFAIEKNRPKCLKILLQKGASPNANDGKHFAIHKAAGSGSEELVEILCQHGVNLTTQDINGQSAVHYAVYYQNLPILINLIYHNANLDIADSNGQTAVHYAVYYGSMLFLRALVMAKANIDICDQTGRTPLFVAIWKGNLEIIKLLLINQATTDVAAAIDLSPLSTQEIITPVMYAAAVGLHEALELLLNAGGDPHLRKNENKRSALFYAFFFNHKECVDAIRIRSNIEKELMEACEQKDLSYVKLLLKLNPDLYQVDELGETAVTKAAASGSADVLQHLLEVGADVDPILDREYGKTPLMAAAVYGKIDCLNMLLERNAIINRANEYGQTALWFAAKLGRTDCICTLLKAGADANLASKTGTPLIASIGKHKAFKTLLDHGCDVNYVNANGDSALILATHHTRDEYFNDVMQHKPDVKIVDGKEWSPVMIATSKKKYHRLKALLECGADTDHADSQGTTALHLAAEKHFTSGMKLLLSYKPRLNVLMKKRRYCMMRTPLTSAINGNSKDCVILLLQHGAIASLPRSALLRRVMTRRFEPKVVRALHAAGTNPDSLPDIVYRGNNMKPVPLWVQYNQDPNYPTDLHDQDHDKSLFNLCRLSIRQHLLHTRPYNLFHSVPQLPVPCIIQNFLLFNIDLHQL